MVVEPKKELLMKRSFGIVFGFLLSGCMLLNNEMETEKPVKQAVPCRQLKNGYMWIV